MNNSSDTDGFVNTLKAVAKDFQGERLALQVAAVSRAIHHTLLSTDRPLLAQLVITRRCNLSCVYCNEYDKVSPPIPVDVLKARVKALANLKTMMVTCTGGETLLHPDLAEIIQEIRRLGMLPTIITNGYLLTQQRIEELNEAGLHSLQISIDNLVPDSVSAKSLNVLDKKLQLLADHARFEVNINSVLGISDERTADAITVAERANYYGLSHTVALLHDGNGTLKPLSATQRTAYQTITRITKSVLHYVYRFLFQQDLIDGKPLRWKCRAGARYLYICEDGLVHWCSQQRGYPGIPVTAYTVADIQREFNTQKGCSTFCTLPCVHLASVLDEWRGEQTLPDPLVPHVPLESIG